MGCPGGVCPGAAGQKDGGLELLSRMPPHFSKHLGQVLAPPDPGMEEQGFPLPHSCHAGDGRDRLGTAQKTRGDQARVTGGVRTSLVPSIPVGSSALCPQAQTHGFHPGHRCSLMIRGMGRETLVSACPGEASRHPKGIGGDAD